MYTNYVNPKNSYYTKSNYQNFKPTSYNTDDRFLGSGFLAPFILGGIAGNIIRPNYYNQGPIPVYIPPQMPYYPPYSNTNIYY